MNQKGFAPILILIIAVVASVLIYVSIKDKSISSIFPSIKPIPTSTSIPSPTPTASPIPSPSIKPTSTPSKTPFFTPKPSPITTSGAPGVGYSRVTIHTEKGDFVASVLSIDMGSSRMITDTANDSDCGSNCPVLTLQDFINRNGGFAGVNGTYFCPAEPAYSSCGAGNNYDFPVYNTRLSHWLNAGNLSWNSRSIVYTDGSGAHYLQNANSFGGGLTAGIVNYPGLIDAGNVQIDDNQSGLSDKQKAVGTKVGIGVVGTGKILVVIASSVNMQQFAYIFKSLGATGAMNLDEGGSTALYYNGYKIGPGRNIPNAVIFAPR